MLRRGSLGRLLPRRGVFSSGNALSLRALSTGSAREVDLLKQVSRLEARVHELEGVLPERVQPRIPKWDELAFAITPTNGHVRHTFSSVTSAWDAGRFVTDPYVNLHIHAGVLHYGMSLFEGCKAFRCKDGKARAHGCGVIWQCGLAHRDRATPRRCACATCRRTPRG